MLTATAFFDLSRFAHPELFPDNAQAWTPLTLLGPYLETYSYPALDRTLVPDGVPLPNTAVFYDNKWIDGRECTITWAKKGIEVSCSGTLLAGASVIMAGAVVIGDQIALGRGVIVEAGALVKGPIVTGDQTEIRHGAYLRGRCLAGSGCVLGHTTEVKNSILLDGAKAGHFAYLGDSILGCDVNLGAGTKLANLRFTGGTVPVRTKEGSVDTGLRKLGAILGDQVQTGCNSVTNPGTLLGKKSLVLPNTTVPSGYHGASSLIR